MNEGKANMPDIAEQIAKPDPIATLRALADAQAKVAENRKLGGFHLLFFRQAVRADFANLLRAFEELQFEVEKWKAATGMDDPIEFSQKSLSYIATMNKKLKEIEANLTNQPERP